MSTSLLLSWKTAADEAAGAAKLVATVRPLAEPATLAALEHQLLVLREVRDGHKRAYDAARYEAQRVNLSGIQR